MNTYIFTIEYRVKDIRSPFGVPKEVYIAIKAGDQLTAESKFNNAIRSMIEKFIELDVVR